MYDYLEMAHRCLQLAALGLGKVGASPMNAWIWTDPQGKILSEGWLPEVSIRSKITQNTFTEKPTTDNKLFLGQINHSIEDFLILLKQNRIKQVFTVAPASQAIIRILEENQIFIKDNLLPEKEAYLNRRFYCYQSQKRPFIILKWAETADGFIARKNYDSKWISNLLSRRLVHKWRSEEQAIMVGTQTAHFDDPRLNVRSWSGKDPVRVVIDKSLRLTPVLHLFDGSQATLCYNLKQNKKADNTEWVKINEENFLLFFMNVLDDLYRRGVYSIIIEGGAQLLNFLFEHQLWDEARVFKAPLNFADGVDAPRIKNARQIAQTYLEGDLLTTYQKLNKK